MPSARPLDYWASPWQSQQSSSERGGERTGDVREGLAGTPLLALEARARAKERGRL